MQRRRSKVGFLESTNAQGRNRGTVFLLRFCGHHGGKEAAGAVYRELYEKELAYFAELSSSDGSITGKI